jgi:hypothetical protein
MALAIWIGHRPLASQDAVENQETKEIASKE